VAITIGLFVGVLVGDFTLVGMVGDKLGLMDDGEIVLRTVGDKVILLGGKLGAKLVGLKDEGFLVGVFTKAGFEVEGLIVGDTEPPVVVGEKLGFDLVGLEVEGFLVGFLVIVGFFVKGLIVGELVIGDKLGIVGEFVVHSDFLIILASRVIAALAAKTFPILIAPVVKVTLVEAKIFPKNSVFVPRVAELPTCQKTLHAEPRETTIELLAVVRVLDILKTNNGFDSPKLFNTKVPVS
jgi:hypothetical protein